MKKTSHIRAPKRMIQNDDILKKSSNTLETSTCDKACKFNGFRAFSDMVSNAPMGNPKKDMTP